MAQAAVRPATPVVVLVVAGMLALLAVVNVVRVLVQVPMILADEDWDAGASRVFVVLNGFTVLFSAFLLLLAHFLRRGRLWAWITAITVLALTLPWGAVGFLAELVDDRIPWIGMVILLPALGMLLALTVPATARRFFLPKPAGFAPYQPGPWPVRPGNGDNRPY
jgi:hypothetical protein